MRKRYITGKVKFVNHLQDESAPNGWMVCLGLTPNTFITSLRKKMTHASMHGFQLIAKSV